MTSKDRPRGSRVEKIINDTLVAANGCLALVAILLASLIFIQLQLQSWQVGALGGAVPTAIERGISLS